MTTPDTDVLIIGGGSAGLSAGLMLARSRRTVTVLDGGAPRNAPAAHMHGVIGRDGWSPLDLVSTGRDEVRRYGGAIVHRRAVAIHRDFSGFITTLDDSTTIRARRLLFATGLVDDLPKIPGLAQYWGRGVAHCPYCDGWEARDARIAVVASGPGSIHQVQLLRQLSEHVTYFVEGTDLPEPALAGLVARGIKVETRRIASIDSHDGRIDVVRLYDGAEVAIDSVFVRPRAVPNDGMLRELGAATETGPDGQLWVAVDPTGRTSLDGVWAAGNVTNPTATVPVAAAAGSSAGAAINADLVDDEIRTALASASIH